MQTRKTTLLVVALVLMVLCNSGPINAQGSLVRDSLYGSSLENNPLGDPVTRYLQIYLPPGYDTAARNYPVVYLFHTGTASERFYPYNEFPPIFASYGMFMPPQDFPESGFAAMIDSLILMGKIEPLIIAMPNVNSAYGGSFCINSSLNGNYEDYIVKDIVPYVDANYRTLANRNSRAIAGHCMGGYGATSLAMKHPDVFGAVAGHSADLCIASIVRALQPMIVMENPGGITGPDVSKPFISFLYMFSAAFSPNLQNPPYFVDLPVDDTCAIREDILIRWAEHDPIRLFTDHRTDLQSLRGIYFDVGNNDELQSSYFMIPFVDSLNAGGISNSFEIFEGTHFSKLYTRLKLSLAYLSGVLDHSDEGPTEVPTGKVSGTWTKEGSPYTVQGEITIPDGKTLVIEPGAKVLFQGHYKLNVQGRLLAVGTEQDTITFTAQDTETGWNGLRFIDTPASNDSSIIKFCRLQFGMTTQAIDGMGGAIKVKGFSKLMISNCLIIDNKTIGDQFTGGGGIGIVACSPIVENNTICGNTAEGGHGGGILVFGSSDPIIRNNLVFNNHAFGGGAFASYQCNPVLINNTITKNTADHGGGIDCIMTSPILINTVIYGNTSSIGSQVHCATPSEPGFFYCDIEGGTAAFARDHASGGSYSGTYENNLDADPLFLDPTADDFHLSDGSPGIGAGADSVETGSKWYFIHQTDFAGNSRPNPSGSIPDIGALESNLGQPYIPTGINDLQLIPNSILRQNYPNPFISETTIGFSVLNKSTVKLQVFDILGRSVAILADDELWPGEYQVLFNATGLKDGIYYYRLTTGNSMQTRKCMVVK